MFRASFYVPKDLWKKAKEYADEKGYSGVSAVIREFLRNLMEEKGKNEQP